MKRNNPLIIGTFILTLTGIISRIIGFFYRIYLSRLFGEEGMGVYQLLSPVLSLSFALTAAGMQTAISKYVAEVSFDKSGKVSRRILLTGSFISFVFSVVCTYFLYHFSETIATRLLLEERTASMIRIIAFSVPLSAIHACVNGYFYGMKKTALPAVTQLLEQVCRVGCVYFAHLNALKYHTYPTINVAVIGLVVGEFFAVIVCIAAAWLKFFRLERFPHADTGSAFATPQGTARLLLGMAVPLSLNRIVINLLQSVEAVQIPNRLLAYGYDTASALSIYGVLTGMALPLILFPGALTNSVSVLLLPVVSEADASGNQALIKKAVAKTIRYCSILGFSFMLIFLLFGRLAGQFLFHSNLAGHFIMTLSFICPFLYLNTTLSSIMHGLGKAGTVFFINAASLLIRLAFVFYAVPHLAITGYLYGLLASQIFDTAALLFFLIVKRKNKYCRP